jgi:ADP-ribose pyrophosphatase YjhB (NUDIX family)
MPKAPTKTTKLRPTKEVSVMAWIEDSDQNILLVRQAAGLKLWTLPGGKVKRGESLVSFEGADRVFALQSGLLREERFQSG